MQDPLPAHGITITCKWRPLARVREAYIIQYHMRPTRAHSTKRGLIKLRSLAGPVEDTRGRGLDHSRLSVAHSFKAQHWPMQGSYRAHRTE